MFVAFFSGCFLFKLIKYLSMDPKKIEAPLIAIDYFLVKPQQIITRGTVRPPPPIPPTLAIPTKAGSTRNPMNSAS